MDYNNSEKYENNFVDIINLLFVNNEYYLYLKHNNYLKYK